MRRTSVFLVVLAALAAGVSPARARAQELMDVPLAIQIPLFVKVLSFDRQLHERAGVELTFAVAFQGGNRASVAVKDEVLRLLTAERSALDGIAIVGVAIDLDSLDFATHLRATEAHAVYVTPLRGIDIGRLAASARSAGVTTISGVPRHISQGLSVGVRVQGERPRLIINVRSARLEGADFSADLLRLAQVIK
jgi:hypothetical protein